MPPTLGLALSGGGARGLAHIGILKVLERESIPISLITGTSMGGLLCSLFAAGYPAAMMETITLDICRPRKLVRMMDIAHTRRGLVDPRKLRNLLAELFNVCVTFTDLNLPVALMAVDLKRGQEVCLTEGSIIDAVLATTAVPGLFPPVVLNGRELVDGGVLNNLPADVARRLGADRVIAVDVIPEFTGEPYHEQLPSILPPFGRDLYAAEVVMTSAITRTRLAESPPDLLLRPELPSNISVFWGFHRAAEAIAAGEQAAERALPQIRLLYR